MCVVCEWLCIYSEGRKGAAVLPLTVSSLKERRRNIPGRWQKALSERHFAFDTRKNMTWHFLC